MSINNYYKNIIILLLTILVIKIFGVYFATHIFHYYSPLIDANLYINEYYRIPDGAIQTGEIRTNLIQNLVLFAKLFFSNNFFIHLFFGILSLIGFIYGIFKKLVSPIMTITLVLPSSLIWTSVVGKEAVFFGFYTLIIFIWISYCFYKINKIDLLFLLVAIVICTLLRPHYTIALGWLFFSTIIIKNLIHYKNIILLPFFSLICFVCFLFFYSDAILWKILSMIDFNARASRFDYLGIHNPSYVKFTQHRVDGHALQILEYYSTTILEFKQAISKYWLFSIIGPLPSELLNRIEFIPFFIEGCIIFVFPLIIYLLSRMDIKEILKEFDVLFYYAILPSLIILIIIHTPFSILNPGSGIRWRVNFEATFYLLPFLLYTNCKYKKLLI